MKITFLIYFIILLISGNLFSQNVNHPTISNVTINYKSLPQATLNVAPTLTNTSIKVVPQATITLINLNNISTMYFKIINITTGAIEYESNYNINSNTIKGPDGKKYFEKNNNIIYMNIPRHLATSQYIYNVFTKNNNNISSPIYSITY